MKVLNIDPDSPLFGHVRPGYRVVQVNGSPVRDSIDFRFRVTDERVNISFADPAGREIEFQFDEFTGMDLGVTLDDHRIKFCKNDCIFCFVSQQPQGMRRTLYFKDEDYRLSFTHGNFITLSNTTDADIARIIEQRLSPLYVSVHATDDTLRRCMLRNERLAPIIPRLKQLGEGGITVHTQVVLCPGVNDGEHLERTIEELAALWPSVATLAVVPVGLTKYRQHLPNLRVYTKTEAGELIDYIESRQTELLKVRGTRFVWPADELYVIAESPFPRRVEYEEMEQFENGIGMCREFITLFNRRRSRLKRLSSKRRILMLTGHSAFGFFNSELMPYLANRTRLQIALHSVRNHFWGESVTVSGLLTGQDLLRHARSHRESYDVLVLPPNCLNDDDLFLDNLSLAQFKQVLGKPVVVGQYNLAATLTDICS